jgi:hypothetical protein
MVDQTKIIGTKGTGWGVEEPEQPHKAVARQLHPSQCDRGEPPAGDTRPGWDERHGGRSVGGWKPCTRLGGEAGEQPFRLLSFSSYSSFCPSIMEGELSVSSQEDAPGVLFVPVGAEMEWSLSTPGESAKRCPLSLPSAKSRKIQPYLTNHIS